ncbi:hypothetical protein HaLaN_32772, partial [Haematococcus lacustris]
MFAVGDRRRREVEAELMIMHLRAAGLTTAYALIGSDLARTRHCIPMSWPHLIHKLTTSNSTCP